MVRTERKAEHKPPPIEHTSHIRKTPEKLSSVLNNRTLCDITHLLDPNKRNSSDSPITFLTHTIHCHDRTHKHLLSLDLDSQVFHMQCFSLTLQLNSSSSSYPHGSRT